MSWRALLNQSSRNQNVFTILLAGAVSSELMWIIRMNNDREELARKTDTRLKLVQSVVDRIKHGEKVDVQKELLTGKHGLDSTPEPVDQILQQLEDMDTQWASAKPGPRTAPAVAPVPAPSGGEKEKPSRFL